MSAADRYAARVDAVLAQRDRLRGIAPPGDAFADLPPDHPQRAKTAHRLGHFSNSCGRIVWNYDRDEIGCDRLAVHGRAN